MKGESQGRIRVLENDCEELDQVFFILPPSSFILS